jgi:hypothetical protein
MLISDCPTASLDGKDGLPGRVDTLHHALRIHDQDAVGHLLQHAGELDMFRLELRGLRIQALFQVVEGKF